MNARIDVRPALPAISLPTLVIHRIEEPNAPQSRHLADNIAGARLVEIPGRDHAPWSGDVERITREIERFVSGIREELDFDRVLAIRQGTRPPGGFARP